MPTLFLGQLRFISKNYLRVIFMKKYLAFLCVLALLFFSSSTVMAHPGRTDFSGGHTDHSTGEYHYHHGFSAHQHEDIDGDGILDCPYEFVDKTGENSGTSSHDNSNSSFYESSNEDVQDVPVISDAKPYTKESLPTISEDSCMEDTYVSESPKTKFKLRYVLIPLAVALIATLKIWYTIASKKAAKLEAERKARELAIWNEERAKYELMYGGKDLLELVGAPEHCYIAPDGKPASHIGDDKWGDGYSFYTTYSGSKYHLKTCRYAYGTSDTNAYDIEHSKYRCLNPCAVCKPIMADLSWYEEYLKIKAIKEKYNIE